MISSSTSLSAVPIQQKTKKIPSAASAAMPLARSLPPNYRHSRLTIVRRGCELPRLAEDSWRSHVHRTYIAQRVQLFKIETANVRGRGGRPLVLSLGGYKGGYSLSRKRVSPFYALPHGAGIVLLHRCRKKLFYASGVKIPFSVTSIVQRISCSSTGTSGDMSCSRQMSTVGQWSCGSRRS
mgnify:CR=1 FL=1